MCPFPIFSFQTFFKVSTCKNQNRACSLFPGYASLKNIKRFFFFQKNVIIQKISEINIYLHNNKLIFQYCSQRRINLSRHPSLFRVYTHSVINAQHLNCRSIKACSRHVFLSKYSCIIINDYSKLDVQFISRI